MQKVETFEYHGYGADLEKVFFLLMSEFVAQVRVQR